MDSFEKNQLGIDLLPNGETRGKDPRKICLGIFLGKWGMRRDPYFSVIRDKCLDCSHTAF